MSRFEQIQALLAEQDDYRADVDARAKLLAMPVIQFPADYAALVGVNEKTAYDHAKAADFPPMVTLGRQKLMRTDALVSWLLGKEKEQAT